MAAAAVEMASKKEMTWQIVSIVQDFVANVNAQTISSTSNIWTHFAHNFTSEPDGIGMLSQDLRTHSRTLNLKEVNWLQKVVDNFPNFPFKILEIFGVVDELAQSGYVHAELTGMPEGIKRNVMAVYRLKRTSRKEWKIVNVKTFSGMGCS